MAHIRFASHLGVGVVALKVALDFINEQYRIKCESDLDKLLIENIEEEE